MHVTTQDAVELTESLIERFANAGREVQRIARSFFEFELLQDQAMSSLMRATEKSGESAVVQQLLHFMRHPSSHVPLDCLSMSPDDTVVLEYTLKIGRADIVIFHVDGSASVIEVKDGATGYRSVVAGIGQASLYACQIAALKVSLKDVRRVLAWSSIGNDAEDRVVKEACEMAGVLPIQLFGTNQIKRAFDNAVQVKINSTCLTIAESA